MATANRAEQSQWGNIESVVDLLGGAAVFPDRPQDVLAAHRLIEKGFPNSALSRLVDNMGILAHESVLQHVLGVSKRTVQRKREAEAILNSAQSGRTWKFAEILAKAIDIFGSQEEAERWLDEPAIGLEGNKPIMLLSTPAGVEAVESLLDRLNYGVYT